jgi:protein-tyrosine kinase
MGRIDEALRRSNLDAAQGTGAEAAAPATSPWQVGLNEDGDAPGPEAPFAGVQEITDPVGSPAPAEEPRPASWAGVDDEAVKRLVIAKAADPLVIEQYRHLATTLLRAQGERELKTLIVTSASPGDGKSHVAVNLALTLSESFRRQVLLVDADLRRPMLHLLFGVSNRRGLSDALTDRQEHKVATVPINDTLTLVPAGRPQANPLGGLSSDRLKRIVADASSRFDWVIVDSPPVGVLADAHLVSESVDAAILVVRAGVTQFPDLEAAADTLGRERILGVVLNAVDPIEIRGEAYYYSHYYGGGRGKN